MNWEFILSLLLAFALLFVIFMTLGFYISYKRDQRLGPQEPLQDPTRGKFFKRYVPEALKPKYQNSDVKKVYLAERERYKKVTKLIVLIPITAFVLTLGYFWNKNKDFLYAPIQLNKSEKLALNMKKFSWKSWSDPQKPKLLDLEADLKSRRIVFVSNINAVALSPELLTATDVIYKEVTQLAQNAGAEIRNCYWESIASCQSFNSKNIFVILPSYWNLSALDAMLKSNSRILMFGPPLQITNVNVNQIQWDGFVFERTEGERYAVLTKGDALLTLGIDAGTIFEFAPILDKVKTKHVSTQAYRLPQNRILHGPMNASWVASAKGAAKYVWLDFAPDLLSTNLNVRLNSDTVLASSIRFLMDREYSAIATWPKKYKAAAFIAGDIEDEYALTAKVLPVLKSIKAPVSWFSISSLAQGERGLTKEMSALGTVHCQGDEHERFDTGDLKEQTERLALCIKSLKEITQSTSLGFRPPEEAFNDDTLSAVQNLKLDFLLVGKADQLSPILIKDEATNSRLVKLHRSTSDDHVFFVANSFTQVDVLNLVSEELQWVKNSAGIYFYDFHSQHLDQEVGVSTLASIAKTLVADQEMWLTSPEDIAAWWKFRANLSEAKITSQEDMLRFAPHRLRVTQAGELHVEPVEKSK